MKLCQGLVGFNICTDHREIYILEKGLNETLHSIVKLVISKSLCDKKKELQLLY